jgi:hypothetical protein
MDGDGRETQLEDEDDIVVIIALLDQLRRSLLGQSLSQCLLVQFRLVTLGLTPR